MLARDEHACKGFSSPRGWVAVTRRKLFKSHSFGDFMCVFMVSVRRATNFQRRIDGGRLRLGDLNQDEHGQLRQLNDNALLDEVNKGNLGVWTWGAA